MGLYRVVGYIGLGYIGLYGLVGYIGLYRAI